MVRWSNKYEFCVKCKTAKYPHAGRGLCRLCYNKAYVNSEFGGKPNFLVLREGCSQKFTDEICTTKKILPIIIYRFYSGERISYSKKVDKAKRYIKNILCKNCINKYIDNWTNDFNSADSILCNDCIRKIFSRIDIAISHSELKWIQNLKKCLRSKRKAIQFELEFRYKKSFYAIAKNWYIIKRMSAREIQELLQNKYCLYISERDLRRWFNELGIMRTHVKAMRNRVVTGRMDYTVRETDYSKRKIDYQERSKKMKEGFPAKRKGFYIELPMYLKRKIKNIAHKSRRTSSEVVRDILLLSKKEGFLKEKSMIQKIKYITEHYEFDLLNKRIKSKRAPLVFIAKKKYQKFSELYT